MLIGSASGAAMEKALSALWERQQIISGNIANEDTPSYKAKRLEFESVLKKELEDVKTSRLKAKDKISALNSVKTTVYEQANLISRADGNNVDLDSEYIEMARTSLHYNALQAKINGEFSKLKYVIGGGR